MKSYIKKNYPRFSLRFIRDFSNWILLKSAYLVVLYISSDIGIYFSIFFFTMGLIYKLRVQWTVLYSVSLNNGFVTFSFLRFNKKTESKLNINDVEIKDVSGPIGTTYKIRSKTLKYTLHKNYFLNKNEIQILKKRFDSYKKRYLKLERRRIRDLKSNENEG